MKKIITAFLIIISFSIHAQRVESIDDFDGFKKYRIGNQIQPNLGLKKTFTDGKFERYQITDTSILTFLGREIIYASVECLNKKIIRINLSLLFKNSDELGTFSVDVLRLLGKYTSLDVHPSDNPNLTCTQWAGNRIIVEKCSEPNSNYVSGAYGYSGEIRIWSKSESTDSDY